MVRRRARLRRDPRAAAHRLAEWLIRSEEARGDDRLLLGLRANHGAERRSAGTDPQG
jgi:hypothetical protein